MKWRRCRSQVSVSAQPHASCASKAKSAQFFEFFMIHVGQVRASAPELTQWSQAMLPFVPASAHIRLDGVSIWTVA